MGYENAYELLRTYTGSVARMAHARSVETVMRTAAHRHSAGAERNDVAAVMQMLGANPAEHIQFTVGALKTNAEQRAIVGEGAKK